MKIFRFLLMLVACLLASRAAQATVVVAADLDELTRDARTIVRGRVVALEARLTDDRRRVETLVTLEAESYLKGTLGATVQFRVPGGQLGRFRSIFVGAPEFVPGQRVVVFLGVRGPSIPYVLGLSQGAFHVEPGADGWTVMSPAIPTATAQAGKIVRGDPERRPMALAEFERQVRVLVGASQ